MARPNIVLIMTDQQRADLSMHYGYPADTMPFVNSLGDGGVWFDKAYTTTPQCAPARVSMLTGRYPSATRVRTNSNIPDATYGDDLIDVLKANGYLTGLAGKNHSHLKRGDLDYWYEAAHAWSEDDDSPEYQDFGKLMRSMHMHAHLEPNPHPVECQYPYRVVSKAQEWIDSIDGPFFLWMSFSEPHNPYQVPKPYFDMFPPENLPPTLTDETHLPLKGFKYEWCRESFIKAFPNFVAEIPRYRSNYLGLLRLIDDQVKRFTEYLDAHGLREDTIIIYLSDHGDFVGEYGLMRKGPELPEALTRIPLVVNGPCIAEHDGPHTAHVSLADVMPTICEAIGADIPSGTQGRSLWPMLTGQSYPEDEFQSVYAEQGMGGLYYGWNEELDPRDDGRQESSDGQKWGGYDCLNSWTQSGQMRMVRKGDWKLVYDMMGNGQLHNLVDDPSEIRNLFGTPDHSEKENELLKELLAWTLRTQDSLPKPRHRYVLKEDPRNYWMPYSDANQ